MPLQKSATVMALQRRQQQQQRHPVVVLLGALLLLCLVLLVRVSVLSAFARPAASENKIGYFAKVVRQFKGGVRSQEVFRMADFAPQIESNEEADRKQCGSLPDSTTQPCAPGLDRRILDGDYGDGSPDRNPDTHPAGPLP